MGWNHQLEYYEMLGLGRAKGLGCFDWKRNGQATNNIFPNNVHRTAAEKLEAYEKTRFKGKDRVCHLRKLYWLELEKPG